MIGFWIFMLIMNLLTPVTMVGLGGYFNKQAPRKINDLFGYRTTMSMKNQETWEFAHHHFGRIWKNVGMVLIIPTVIAMVFLFGYEVDTIGTYGGVICGVQMLVLLLSIFPTEIALRHAFSKNGQRRLNP